MKVLDNEFGSGSRCRPWQFCYCVIAFVVDLDHLIESPFRFGEVLLSLAVGFIYFLPRRGKKDKWGVSVLPTRVQNEMLVGETDQPSVAERVRDAAIREYRARGRGVCQIR